MDVVARNSGGYSLVGRPQARRPWYPTNRVRPVRVEIWRRFADEVAAAAIQLGTFSPGQTVKVHFPTNADHTMIFSVVTISPNGLRSVRELADAHEVAHDFEPGGGPPLTKAVEAPAVNPLTIPTGVRFKRG